MSIRDATLTMQGDSRLLTTLKLNQRTGAVTLKLFRAIDGSTIGSGYFDIYFDAYFDLDGVVEVTKELKLEGE